MYTIKFFITALLVICFGKISFSQGITNEGKEFWLGYGHHQFMEPGQTNSQELVLYLSAGSQPATVTVSINSTTWTRTYNIPAGTVIASDFLPKSGTFDCRLYSVPPSFGGTGGEGIFTRGINIKSNVPIVAYAHIFGSVSSGATMLMPIESWGYNYYTINSRQVDAGGPGYNWAYCVAQHDNTTVRITPAANTRPGKPAGVPFTVTLNKGEIYQIVGQSDGNGNGNEFTGSRFESIANANGDCYPIAVFAGSSRTRGEDVPCGTASGRDNDIQQCFPTQAWGKKYFTAPFSTSNGPTTNPNLNASTFMTHVYKVMVKDPTTVVKRNGVTLTGLINNSHYKFSSNTADVIEADKPIMLGQFMSGSPICNPGTHGDPEMVYPSPVAQAINKVIFFRNTRESIYSNYVTIIIPTAGVSSLRIDGSNTFNHTYPHPNAPGYTVVVKGWKSAQAQTTVVSDSAFTAITYGLGGAESYAYNAGTYLNNLNLLGSIRNSADTTANVLEHDYTCKGSPVKLSALYVYKPLTLRWQISSLGAVITPNNDYVDNSPVAVDSTVINGVKYYKYSAPGTYIFNDTGTFQIPITSTHPSIENCKSEEKLSYFVTVKPKPVPIFTMQNTGCTADTVKFFGNNNAAATGSSNYTVNQHLWVLPTNDSIKNINAQKLFPPGTHNIKHRIVTTMGCEADSSFSIVVGDRPSANFTTSPASICERDTMYFIDNSGVLGTGPGYNFYWDFGNGTVVNANSNATQTTTYPLYGTYTVKHFVATSATCKSDTVTRTVTVYAKPRTNFNFPTGCVPPSGLGVFTNTTTIPDGQSLSYLWTFNDPSSTPSNPNTATTTNASHFFDNGIYNIKLEATTNFGCKKDTTIPVEIKKLPSFSYAQPAPVCVNITTPINLDNITITNGVAGTGVHSGPGMATNGLFTPSSAGPGTHTLRYIFTTVNGCVDSVLRTIVVHPKPIVNFTTSAGPCIDTSGIVTFSGTSNIAVNAWLWTNGGATFGNTQNTVDTFAGNSTNLIKLTAVSSQGCIGDTTKSIVFNVRPRLVYPTLASVCVNTSTPVNVASASVINTAVGTGVYSGPGTSATGIFTPNVAGVGTHTIWYKVTTPNGCTDSISQTILVKAKPIVNFTYPTGGCLPSNGLAQFNGIANLSDAQTITNWAWNFNDPNANGANPNTSNLQNPTHNYSANGIYNVQLTATSSGGCIGDTTIQLNLNLKPALSYPPLPPVCQSVVGTVNVATATVTNGAAGTGVYSGPHTTAAGQFNPSAAGAGTFTIWYKFTTPNGCTDSISQTINVQPKPNASFTKTDVCQGLNATFTSTSSISSGTITTYNWQFGDGTSASYSTGASFTKVYNAAGTYTVKLVVISSAGCTSDEATETITIYPNPTVDFSTPASVCMPGNPTTFTSLASIPGNGSLTYSWNFGDGNTSSSPNPSHVYAAIGNYNITLTVTSANGCIASRTKSFNSFFTKPIASFNTNKDSVCFGNDFILTNTSTDPLGSPITTHLWTFSDGTNANTINVTKRFTQPSNFTATLRVTNAAGCISDPITKPLVVNIQPVIDAGPSFTVLQGSTIRFAGTSNSTIGISFAWTPANVLTGANTLTPTHVATQDRTFTLTATGVGNCVATDHMTVKILKPVKIPNAFSPNGDGINDTWIIENLLDYSDCIVQIYNRYGQKLFEVKGYSKPWDGTINGKPLPVATYYYIIDLKNGLEIQKGSVTIIR